MKYIWGLLTVIYLWVAFYIGSIILSSEMEWYGFPYIITGIFVFGYLVYKTVDSSIED